MRGWKSLRVSEGREISEDFSLAKVAKDRQGKKLQEVVNRGRTGWGE